MLSLLLLAATAISLASCSKDDAPKESDNNNGNNNDNPENNVSGDVKVVCDDLGIFQDYFVITDSVGNFLHRSMGVPLYDNDTAHLYIGVDDIDEALLYFD